MLLLKWIRELFYWGIYYQILSLLGCFWSLKNVNQESGKEIPIVLLYGWSTRNLQMFTFKKRLEKLGYKVYTPDLGSNIGKIENISEKLHNYIKKNKIKRFTLIGHSMGGVIGLYYYHKYKPKIQKFIGLASPFFGSKIAKWFFFSPGALQLRKGSLFMNKLQNKVNGNFYSIAAKHDQLVSIESTRLKGAKHIIVDHVGHTYMLASKKVFDEIAKILNT